MFLQKTTPQSYYLIDNPKKLGWLKSELLGAEEFAFDIETNHPTLKGESVPSGYVEVLSGVSFAWKYREKQPWVPGTAAYVPISRGDDSPFWKSRQEAALGVIGEILASSVPKIAQNGKFDVRKLHELAGITVNGFNFDVMLAHTLIDEGRLKSSHALKSEPGKIGMADVYLDLSASAFKHDLASALEFYDPKWKRYSRVPLEILYPYGCADSDLALALKHVFRPLLEAEGLTWVFETLIMPLQRELTYMELHGVPCDLEVTGKVKVEQEKIVEETASEIYKLCEVDPFNIGSARELGSVLFEKLGFKGHKTEKGQWATDVDALKAIDHSSIPYILKWKRAGHILSAYVNPVLENVQEKTCEDRIGWIHPKFYLETVTGRLTMSDPILNTLPKPENGGDIVKTMFAGDPDYRFIFKDYSQVELRVIAHLSQEPVWIETFKNDWDMHAAMAQKIWYPECDVNDIKKLHKDSRSNAKAVNFGIAYGQTIYALAESLGITAEAADKLVNEDYFGAAPVLKAWIDSVHEFAETNGYVYSMFGRRRHLPDAMLKIPDPPWGPPRDERPKCFGKGAPNLEGIGIEYDDIFTIGDQDLSDRIIQTGLEFLYECVGCSLLKVCMANREVKRLKGKKNAAMRQAVNAPVQSSAVDMTSLALVWGNEEFRRQGLDCRMLMHTHDELAAYCHVSCVEVACRIMDFYMIESMEKLFNFSVPLKVDTAIVYRMSEKHDKE